MSATEIRSLNGYKLNDETARSNIEKLRTESQQYTDTKISQLINSAPTTLDTLGEIAAAMAENATVVEALNAAIGSKADKNDIPSLDGLATEEFVNNAITNLSIPTAIIAFKIENYGLYFAREGMTWSEWCDSIYNIGYWSYATDGVFDADDYVAISTEKVSPEDVIISE